jgi:hypothetical protein
VAADALKNGAALRGLDSAAPPLGARLCIWKNTLAGREQPGSGCLVSGASFKTFMLWLVALNVLAVVAESCPSVAESLPHTAWQGFEAASVGCFALEFALNLATSQFDPAWGFSRSAYASSLQGTADWLSILPFALANVALPLLAPSLVFDATVFRVLRLSRVLELESCFEAFTMLGDVVDKAKPVLEATGVLALILWVGAATAFYYIEPHADPASHDDGFVGDDGFSAGGEPAAVFTSIVDALYYTSIFMAGEWCVADFSPVGAVLCAFMSMVGVALFSIPVGVLFEGFQDMLTEKHGGGGSGD